ncbi:VWA domain-containing protein [Candidatus Bathyarchaeota archaeon]|nr:MAG: VWA domain-containing protein [Candidatus Bathyarchaeota archaeon]
MKKYLSICCVVLLIISALSITAERLSIHADVTDTYVTLDKTATDYEITCGQEILMNLTVNGTGVGGPLDIMLVIDRSSSMLGKPLDAAKAAAKSFIDNHSFTGDPATSDWVGISSYATTASLDQELTDNSTLAKSAINGLSAGLSSRGYTNIMAGVHVAQEELATNGRNHAMDIIIVLSDGVANRWTSFTTGTTYETATWPATHTTSTLKAIDEATAAKNAGTIVFTIGLNLAALGPSQGVARDTLEQMATSLDYFFDAATPGYLEEIYGRIATHITPAATNLTLTDVVEDEFVIVGGSTDPPATSVVGNTITWEFDTLGSETKTFQYKMRPIRGLEGWYPTNVEANLTYTDPEGNPASQTFPNPLIYLYRVCTPAIQIIKTANPTVINKGEKVVYTYDVTNLGPYPLHDVNVTDDQYGTISPAPFDLDVGETKILTYEAYPNATVTNVATAKGKDPWNYTVSDEDDAIVSVIAECPVTFYTDPVGSNFNITFEGSTYVNGDMDTFPYGTSGSAYADCPPGWVFDHWEMVGNVTLDPDEYANPVTFTIKCGGDLKAVFTEEHGNGDLGTIGYWKHVFYVWKASKGNFKNYTGQILEWYLGDITVASDVFGENYTLTLESAHDLLWANPGSNMRRKALRQCFACWLNWANDAVTMSQMVDTNYDGHPDMTFGDAMTIVENILRNPHSILAELEYAKDVCDSINNM